MFLMMLAVMNMLFERIQFKDNNWNNLTFDQNDLIQTRGKTMR